VIEYPLPALTTERFVQMGYSYERAEFMSLWIESVNEAYEAGIQGDEYTLPTENEVENFLTQRNVSAYDKRRALLIRWIGAMEKAYRQGQQDAELHNKGSGT